MNQSTIGVSLFQMWKHQRSKTRAECRARHGHALLNCNTHTRLCAVETEHRCLFHAQNERERDTLTTYFTNILRRRLRKQGDEQGLAYLATMDRQLTRLINLFYEFASCT